MLRDYGFPATPGILVKNLYLHSPASILYSWLPRAFVIDEPLQSVAARCDNVQANEHG
jgi:hypothetical protein